MPTLPVPFLVGPRVFGHIRFPPATSPSTNSGISTTHITIYTPLTLSTPRPSLSIRLQNLFAQSVYESVLTARVNGRHSPEILLTVLLRSMETESSFMIHPRIPRWQSTCTLTSIHSESLTCLAFLLFLKCWTHKYSENTI